MQTFVEVQRVPKASTLAVQSEPALPGPDQRGPAKGSFKGDVDRCSGRCRPLKGDIDIDVEVDVDIDRYFGCLRGLQSQFRYWLMV